MTELRRRRPRPTCLAHSSRRSSMATTAAVSLLALCFSPQGLTPSAVTNAFAPPLSSVRLSQNPLMQMSQTTLNDGGESSSKSYPIRTNQPLYRLTNEEEVSLLRQMRAHPGTSSLSQKARETLMLHNLPLVQSIVTKILRSRPQLRQQLSSRTSAHSKSEGQVGAALTKDDLLHEGTIGLAEAIDRYDLAYALQDQKDSSSSLESSPIIPKGARLGTYATYWIRARILRAIQSREHAFRFPEHVLQASHRLVKASKDMGIKWDVVTELADYDVITVAQKKLRDDLRVLANIKSENLFQDAVRVRSLSQSTSTTPLESWMSPSALATSAMDDLMPTSESDDQEHVLETLSKFLMPREVEVLSLRYGLVTAEDEEEEVALESDPRVFRDYMAEAEDDLFGAGGMLSHYSDAVTDGIAAVASTAKRTKGVSVTAPSAERKTKMKVTASAPSLLSFKEIGKKMEFSGEYCRRTCTQALSKLTQAVEDGRLAESDFLLGW